MTAFVNKHALAWELGMGALTIMYVALAFMQDIGAAIVTTFAVFVFAGLFLVEFMARLFDSPSRLDYLKRHWLDLLTCIPAAGPLRVLRLLRLLAFLRLGGASRTIGLRVAASDRVRGGSILWVLTPVLVIVWVGASYGYYVLERGANPHITTFADALYFTFITASTVGYGDVTPATPGGKVLTGFLIFVGIGLLGFASSQLTAKILVQPDEVSELKRAVERQTELLERLTARVETLSSVPSPAPTLVGSEQATADVS